MKMISELVEGDKVSLQLLVVSANKLVNNTGASYINAELRDASGSINAKKWELSSEDETNFVSGNVIFVTGEVIKYKDNYQLRLFTASLVEESEIDIARFVKAPPVPKNELIDRFNAHVESIQNEDCRKLIDYFVKEDKNLFTYPAASSIHHEYSSGLLMHIISMADLAVFLSDKYEGLNKDLLLTGVILHDFGKLTELEGPIIYKYTTEGKLLGHISIMVAKIRDASSKLNITSEVPLLLEHMILSHHGQLEFGSPVLPVTREALLLYLIDNLDSKMAILSKAYEGVKKGEFTQKIFALDNRSFYNPKI